MSPQSRSAAKDSVQAIFLTPYNLCAKGYWHEIAEPIGDGQKSNLNQISGWKRLHCLAFISSKALGGV